MIEKTDEKSFWERMFSEWFLIYLKVNNICKVSIIAIPSFAIKNMFIYYSANMSKHQEKIKLAIFRTKRKTITVTRFSKPYWFFTKLKLTKILTNSFMNCCTKNIVFRIEKKDCFKLLLFHRFWVTWNRCGKLAS